MDRPEGSGNRRPRAAVVIHRFAPDTGGGAEDLCRLLVRSLGKDWDIDVFTTCSLDHHRWSNDLPAGEEILEGCRVRRFPVERRKRRFLSALLSRTLLRVPHPRALEELWVRALGPLSPDLLHALEAEADGYRVVIFITYLYATTVLGLPRAGPRTLLIPTAHDEPALRLSTHQEAIRRAGALGFLTPEERDLVRSAAGPDPRPEVILGGELPAAAWTPGDAALFRERHGIQGPFLLYLGRLERSKGLPELLSFYRPLRRRLPPLVLAGKEGPLRLPSWARCVGYLSEDEKRGALAACQALILPSVRESLSLVILEAWAQGRPVIARRGCAAVEGQLGRAGAGLTYSNPLELELAVRITAESGAAAELGRRGLEYTRARCQPGSLRARLEPLLEELGWLSQPVPAAAIR